MLKVTLVLINLHLQDIITRFVYNPSTIILLLYLVGTSIFEQAMVQITSMWDK